MTNTSVRAVRKWLGVLTGVSAGAAGLCLMVSCVSIYRAGAFTPELVAAAFRPISLPCYLCLGLIALGLLLDFLFPDAEQKVKAFQTNSQILVRLGQKADLSGFDEARLQELTQLERKRCRAAALRSLVFLFCGVLFLTYALNSSNFHSSQINGSMIRSMYVLLPCLAVSCGAAVWAHIYIEKNRTQSIALLKQAPVKARKDAPAAPKAGQGKAVKLVLTCLAVGLILFGFFTGGTADVLTKAVNICTECVGLG